MSRSAGVSCSGENLVLFLLTGLLASTACSCRGRSHESASRATVRDPVSPAVNASGVPAVVEQPPASDVELDVPSPPGDLSADVASFTDIGTCVRRHRLADPLLGDALDSLGYDRFVVDTCSSLEALKHRRAESCQAISVSKVQRGCFWSLAAWQGEPAHCPREEPIAGVWQHEPSCLAAARHDVRPCAALVGREHRLCEAMVSRDADRCEGDEPCVRRVRRWRSALPYAQPTVPYQASLTVTVLPVAINGLAPGREQRVAMAQPAAAGAVLMRRAGGGIRVLVGELRPPVLTAAHEPSGGFWIDLPFDQIKPETSEQRSLGPIEGRALLKLPATSLGETGFSIPMVATVTKLTGQVNSAVHLTLEATLVSSLGPQKTSWALDTWVRDVVELAR